MKIRIAGMIALAVSLLTGSSALAQRGGDGDWRRQASQHGWILNYNEAKDRARKTGKPIMMVLRCIP